MLSRKIKEAPVTAEEPNRVRAARKALKLTQIELAERLGIEQARISWIERGAYSQLPIETARLFSNFFGCTIDDLFPARDERRIA